MDWDALFYRKVTGQEPTAPGREGDARVTRDGRELPCKWGTQAELMAHDLARLRHEFHGERACGSGTEIVYPSLAGAN